VLQGLGGVVDVAVLREVGGAESEQGVSEVFVLAKSVLLRYDEGCKSTLTWWDMAAASDQT